MIYHICNNYDMCEARTTSLLEANETAQRIANRDNMPAYIDFHEADEDGNTTYRIDPEIKLTQLEQFKQFVAKIPVLDANEIKVELAIIKAGKSEYTEIQQRMLVIRLNQYLVRQ